MSNKLEIKYLPIDSIVKYVNNTRTHSREQIDQIKASVKEFGMCTPIGIHNDVIVYGHARHQAMQELGEELIPTVDLSHLTEAQKKAYVIADNKLALNAEWDMDLLKIEIEELKDLDFDAGLLGFNDVDLKHILDGWESDLEIMNGDNQIEQENNFTLKVTGYKDDEDLIKRDIDTILAKYNGAKCE